MNTTLLELAQNYFIGNTVHQVSTAFGESESGTSAALRNVVPLVLGGLLARAQQPGGAAELLSLAQQVQRRGLLGDLSVLLRGLSAPPAAATPTAGSLPSRGADMMRSLLGNAYAPAVAGISQQAGVGEATVGNLLSTAVAVVLGLLGREAAQNNLDANGLREYLSSQRSSVLGALGKLPNGLGSTVAALVMDAAPAGAPVVSTPTPTLAPTPPPPPAPTAASAVNSASVRAARPEPAGPVASQVARPVVPVATSSRRWLWLLVLLVVGLGVLAYVLRGGPHPAAATRAATSTVFAETTSADSAAPTTYYDAASGNYIYDTGTSTTVKLLDGTPLKVGSTSLEAKLANFLNDNSQAISADKTQGWLVLDRVYFEPGKATLTADSQVQFENLAAILKAYPRAVIQLASFTDDQGAAPANLLLSADRANAARKLLLKAGLEPGRVAARGYGQEHPISSNSTDEGRAQNRRLAIRVVQK
jgi:OOP family OmpA-OmpF porin